MQKLLTTIICAILLIAGVAQAKDVSTWLLGDADSLTARAGYGNPIETGIESQWFSFDETPQVWGAYSVYHFDPIDVNNPIKLAWLPDKVNLEPYLGAHAGLNLNNRGTYVGIIAGGIIQKVIVIEYAYNNFDWQLDNVLGGSGSTVTAGLIWRF